MDYALMINSLIIPLTMFFLSLLIIKYPPKDINGILGYRTKRSRASQKAWDYSQKKFGHYWLNLSFINFLLAFLLFYSNTSNIALALGIMLIQFFILLMPIFFIEKDLKNNKDK